MAVSLGTKLEEEGIAEINRRILPMIYPLLKGLDPRLITGYSILLYFVQQVSRAGSYNHYRCIFELNVFSCTVNI